MGETIRGVARTTPAYGPNELPETRAEQLTNELRGLAAQIESGHGNRQYAEQIMRQVQAFVGSVGGDARTRLEGAIRVLNVALHPPACAREQAIDRVSSPPRASLSMDRRLRAELLGICRKALQNNSDGVLRDNIERALFNGADNASSMRLLAKTDPAQIAQLVRQAAGPERGEAILRVLSETTRDTLNSEVVNRARVGFENRIEQLERLRQGGDLSPVIQRLQGPHREAVLKSYERMGVSSDVLKRLRESRGDGLASAVREAMGQIQDGMRRAQARLTDGRYQHDHHADIFRGSPGVVQDLKREFSIQRGSYLGQAIDNHVRSGARNQQIDEVADDIWGAARGYGLALCFGPIGVGAGIAMGFYSGGQAIEAAETRARDMALAAEAGNADEAHVCREEQNVIATRDEVILSTSLAIAGGGSGAAARGVVGVARELAGDVAASQAQRRILRAVAPFAQDPASPNGTSRIAP